MDPNKWRMLLAAPVASLLLILLVWAFVVRGPVSEGFRVPVIQLHHSPNEPTDCGGRAEFVRLTKDGRTWINSDEIPANAIRAEVAELMTNRAERAVYIEVDSELTYGQFAQFADRVEGATDDLHIVLVSGDARRAFERDHDLCDLHFSTADWH